MSSRAESGLHHVCSIASTADTPWACWCSAITATENSCGSQACLLAKRFRRIRRMGGIRGQSLCWWQRTLLIPTQLKRVARRVTLGLGRDGSYSGDGSGDIFIAFSTANEGAIGAKEKHQITMLPNEQLDPIFLATVQATEEAVINAMVAAVTMTGINDHKVIGLPHERLREVLRKYNRLVK